MTDAPGEIIGRVAPQIMIDDGTLNAPREGCVKVFVSAINISVPGGPTISHPGFYADVEYDGDVPPREKSYVVITGWSKVRETNFPILALPPSESTGGPAHE